MPTTARGLWYPDTSSPANPISIGTTAATSQQAALDALALGEAVPRFASAVARDAAYLAAGITVVSGMMCAILGVPYFFGPTSGNATAHWWPMNNLGLLVSAYKAAGTSTTGAASTAITGFDVATSFTLTEPRYIAMFARFSIADTVANTPERFTATWVGTQDVFWQDNIDTSGGLGAKVINVPSSPVAAAAGTYNLTCTMLRPGAGATGTSTVNAVFLRVFDLGAI